MNLTELSTAEKLAVLDLAILAMYSDAHLALAEDRRMQELLVRLGYIDKLDRESRYGAAVTRVRQQGNTLAALREHAQELAQTFKTAPKRTLALEAIDAIINSDNKVSAQESEYVTAVRMALQG